MRFTQLWIAIVVIIVIATTITTDAAETSDAAATTKSLTFKLPALRASFWVASAAIERQQSIENVDYSPKIGQIMLWKSNPPHHAFGELVPKDKQIIAENANAFPIVFSIDLLTRPAAAIKNFAVRLEDAEGEVFQWRTNTRLREGEWKTITITVDPQDTKKFTSWGSICNGKLDYPVKFRGYAATYDPTQDVEISLSLHNPDWKRP